MGEATILPAWYQPRYDCSPRPFLLFRAPQSGVWLVKDSNLRSLSRPITVRCCACFHSSQRCGSSRAAKVSRGCGRVKSQVGRQLGLRVGGKHLHSVPWLHARCRPGAQGSATTRWLRAAHGAAADPPGAGLAGPGRDPMGCSQTRRTQPPDLLPPAATRGSRPPSPRRATRSRPPARPRAPTVVVHQRSTPTNTPATPPNAHSTGLKKFRAVATRTDKA